MKTRSWISALALMAFVAVGCGGSSDGGTSTVPVQFSVDWAARSRALAAPSSALSTRITLAGASTDGTDFSYVVNRHADAAAYTQAYTSTAHAKVGAHPMTVRFYTQADAAGEVVATASATVTVSTHGTSIGTVTTSSSVSSVAVTPNQVVEVPDTVQLTFTARDAQDHIVAVSPGSAFWSVDEGAERLSVTASGMATGVAGGTANVKVRVDGKTSALTAVTIPAVPAFLNGGFESPALAAGDWQQATATDWGGLNGRGVANGSSIWGSGGHDSAQYAYIQAATLSPGQGKLTQTVNGFVVGRKYKITFWMKHRTGGEIVFGVDPNFGTPMEVLMDGTHILTTDTPVIDDWAMYTTNEFTATQTSAAFTFQGTLPVPSGNKTDILDDIKIVPVAAGIE